MGRPSTWLSTLFAVALKKTGTFRASRAPYPGPTTRMRRNLGFFCPWQYTRGLGVRADRKTGQSVVTATVFALAKQPGSFRRGLATPASLKANRKNDRLPRGPTRKNLAAPNGPGSGPFALWRLPTPLTATTARHPDARFRRRNQETPAAASEPRVRFGCAENDLPAEKSTLFGCCKKGQGPPGGG